MNRGWWWSREGPLHTLTLPSHPLPAGASPLPMRKAWNCDPMSSWEEEDPPPLHNGGTGLPFLRGGGGEELDLTCE